MKTYIAGPMTNIPEWNEPAFKEMAALLRGAGLDVVSPNELHAPDPDKTREWYLRRDLEVVVRECDRVVFLKGWERSWGATLEHHVAKELGYELVYPHEFDRWFAKVTGTDRAPIARPEEYAESNRLLRLVGNSCSTDCTGACTDAEEAGWCPTIHG